jgi:predicted nucleic acid-binding protein
VIVVDASVLTPGLLYDDARGDLIRRRLAGERLTAPGLVDLEVISSLRRIIRAGKESAERAEHALRDLVALPLERVQHGNLAHRIWELRDNLTAYDASYVALAERLDTLLLTADAAFARAPGVECRIELLAVE